MMGIIDKTQMTEEDGKLNFITPALLATGWKDTPVSQRQMCLCGAVQLLCSAGTAPTL